MLRNLLLTGGTLVSGSRSEQSDLLIRDGRIAAIDTHVHLALPIDRVGITTADDFYSGTVAAACGGVTTIIDFALQQQGQSIAQAPTPRLAQAGDEAVVDFGLHVILTDARDVARGARADKGRSASRSRRLIGEVPSVPPVERSVLCAGARI